MASGSRTRTKTVEFGSKFVVEPKGKHLATIVWLHGLGDNGKSWSQRLDNLPLQNIKWICPTAPRRPMAILGGALFTAWYQMGELSNEAALAGPPCAAWFNMGEPPEEGPDNIEGLDASAAYIANLLSTEPADVKLGIGGFGIGFATALYSATCFAQGKYGNGYAYPPLNLRAIFGLNGWLPCSSYIRNKIGGSDEVKRRVASLHVLLSHGLDNEKVPLTYVEISRHTLNLIGFNNLELKTYERVGHYVVPKEMEDICQWLTGHGF